mmetsp:Transcript_29280/g.79253  ORF Transcript_29280/g.79253 Transcript_29280/m.79253 type:complete len:210 (+) Transcript_29280:203-832(+)
MFFPSSRLRIDVRISPILVIAFRLMPADDSDSASASMSRIPAASRTSVATKAAPAILTNFTAELTATLDVVNPTKAPVANFPWSGRVSYWERAAETHFSRICFGSVSPPPPLPDAATPFGHITARQTKRRIGISRFFHKKFIIIILSSSSSSSRIGWYTTKIEIPRMVDFCRCARKGMCLLVAGCCRFDTLDLLRLDRPMQLELLIVDC